MFLIFIRIIRDKSLKLFSYFCNRLSPLALSVFRHDHLAARDMHLTAHLLCDRGVMVLKLHIRSKPIAPLRLTDNILIKETDMCSPCSILTVGRRL